MLHKGHYTTGNIGLEQQTADKMQSDLLSFELVDMFYTEDTTQQAILVCSTGLTHKVIDTSLLN